MVAVTCTGIPVHVRQKVPVPVVKPQIFEVSGATADWPPSLILSEAPRPGNRNSFDSSDERGSLSNDYL